MPPTAKFLLRALVLGWLVSILLLSCAASDGFRQPWRRRAAPLALREPDLDVLHYALDLVILPELRRVEGRAVLHFASTRPGLEDLVLDLVGLEVSSVLGAHGEPLEYSHEGGVLAVHLGARLAEGEESQLVVHYAGRPSRGLWFSGQRPDGSGPTQVFTQGQPEGSRGWFPCVDDPGDRVTSEIRVTLPPNWVAVAPGERIDLLESDTQRIEHWRMTQTHPTYLTSLVAGEFVQQEVAWRRPLLFLTEPRLADRVAPCLGHTAQALEFLERLSGVPYPYAKYSQAAVANFPSGGMENISATTLSDLVLEDERALRDDPLDLLVVHEVAHQWFGDLVSARDWSHLWLHEGFATYASYLWAREVHGEESFRRLLEAAQRRNLEEDRGGRRRPTVGSECVEPGDLFDTRVYEGAAARLHLLSTWMGGASFERGLRSFVREHAGASVTTEDLQRSFQSETDQDLAPFFEDWILGAGFPELEVRWRHDADKGELRLEIEQIQAASLGTAHVFRFPVEVAIDTPAGVRRERIFVDRRRSVYRWPAADEPGYVELDPRGDVPLSVRWRREPSEWSRLASAGPGLVSRQRAVRAQGWLQRRARWTDPEDTTFVPGWVRLLSEDSSPWIRTAAAQALATAPSEPARAALVARFEVEPDVGVRCALLDSLRAYGPDAELAALARRAFEARESYGLMAAALRLGLHVDPEGGRARVRAALDEPSSHDLLSVRLVPLLALPADERALQDLQGVVENPRLHPAARAAGVRALATLASNREEASRLLAPLLDHPSFLLREAVVESLAGLGGPHARRTLAEYYPTSRRASERRRIEGLLNGP